MTTPISILLSGISWNQAGIQWSTLKPIHWNGWSRFYRSSPRCRYHGQLLKSLIATSTVPLTIWRDFFIIFTKNQSQI